MADSLEEAVRKLKLEDGKDERDISSFCDSPISPQVKAFPDLTPERRLGYKVDLKEKGTERVVYNPDEAEDINDWIGIKPSEGDVEYGHSSFEIFRSGLTGEDVFVRNKAKLRRLQSDFDRLKKDKSKVTAEALKSLAEKHKYLTGKLIIYVKWEDMDEIWYKLVKGLVEENPLLNDVLVLNATVKDLRPDAKLYPGGKINIVTRDFRDKDEITRIVENLRRLQIYHKMSYKPDIYTKLDIFKGTSYQIEPGTYVFKSRWPRRNNIDH